MASFDRVREQANAHMFWAKKWPGGDDVCLVPPGDTTGLEYFTERPNEQVEIG